MVPRDSAIGERARTMNAELMQLVYDHDELAELDPAARRLALRALLAERAQSDLSAAVRQLADEIDGFGPISDAMRAASEISADDLGGGSDDHGSVGGAKDSHGRKAGHEHYGHDHK